VAERPEKEKIMKVSNIRNLMLSLSLAFFGTCLMGPVLPMMAQDTRTVTEPSFPAVCQSLTASFSQTYNVPIGINTIAGVDGLDVSPSVDSTTTNPDGARIQAALTACANTGQAVELSMDSTATYNAFISGPLVMPANVTLLVDPGVTLFFSRNARDYNANPLAATNSCGTYGGAGSCAAMISMQSNDSLMGYGKIDGRGGDIVINGYQASTSFPAPTTITWWSLAKQADITGGSQVNPLMIVPKSGSSNITLYKITLLNSPEFHVKASGIVNGFTAWDMKIVTPTWARNTDGIDPQPVNNGTIINSWISDGDDNVALGASGTPGPNVTAQNISILNNHFYAGHGQSIGSFTSGTVQNALWDGNMAAGNGYSGKGSATNALPYTVQTNSISPSNGPTVYPVNFADSVGPSTGIRIKSDQPAGGIVRNITYQNECLLDHLEDIQFTPLYNTNAGSNTPNVSGILFQNLAFLNDANSFGSVQFTGTNTVVSGNTLTYPLGLTLSNVSFPSTLQLSNFVTTGTKGTEMYANLTYGPGAVSSNFIDDWATFVATPADHDTATNNITASALNPPTCNFTYIAPELTGPQGLPQSITYGQPATAVVILTPVVGGAAWPTGSVTLTDSLNGNIIQTSLPGNNDTFFVPLTSLDAGTHTFTAAYLGDTNYVPPMGQSVYTTAGPYTVTVAMASQTISFTGLPAMVTYGGPVSFALGATGGASGNPVTYTVSGPATLSGTTLTLTGPGTVSVTASQAGNANYSAATPVTQTIVAGTVQLITSTVLTKVGGGYQAVVTVKNNGNGTAQNVALTAASLGTAGGSVLPASLGTSPGGGSSSVTLTFPSSAGADGAGVVEKLTGTYTGGTLGGSFRAILP
jgi:polygalacturonase